MDIYPLIDLSHASDIEQDYCFVILSIAPNLCLGYGFGRLYYPLKVRSHWKEDTVCVNHAL